MYAWIAVAVGGALGSVARHGVNVVVHQAWPLLAVSAGNRSGKHRGLLRDRRAGLVATGRLPMHATWREFVFVGILGGFTTFSTFGLDTITLVRSGDRFTSVSERSVTGRLRARSGEFGLRRCGAIRLVTR